MGKFNFGLALIKMIDTAGEKLEVALCFRQLTINEYCYYTRIYKFFSKSGCWNI